MLSFSHIQTASNEKQDGKWLVICMWEGQTAETELAGNGFSIERSYC